LPWVPLVLRRFGRAEPGRLTPSEVARVGRSGRLRARIPGRPA
jgi:hypothetical protein